MPVASNPLKRDFFVYTFWLNGCPFYVGVGRSARASDRMRYVRSLMTPANATKLARKSVTVRVMALIEKRGLIIRLTQTRRQLNRMQALALEKKIIARYVRQGFQLTNWQHNPRRTNDERAALRAILAGGR